MWFPLKLVATLAFIILTLGSFWGISATGFWLFWLLNPLSCHQILPSLSTYRVVFGLYLEGWTEFTKDKWKNFPNQGSNIFKDKKEVGTFTMLRWYIQILNHLQRDFCGSICNLTGLNLGRTYKEGCSSCFNASASLRWANRHNLSITSLSLSLMALWTRLFTSKSTVGLSWSFEMFSSSPTTFTTSRQSKAFNFHPTSEESSWKNFRLACAASVSSHAY